MPPKKRWRRGSSPRGAASTVPAAAPLPSDILLEIAARSDAVTLFRCAAACKSLRREILRPDFIRRVCSEPDDGGIVPARPLLGFIDDTFNLVHPDTRAMESLVEDRIAPFVSRGVAGLRDRGEYRPVTSRRGLVLLESQTDMCVYDPMTNARTFLPLPAAVRGPYEHSGGPVHHRQLDHLYVHVLLTADDGIGCSFRVIAVDFVTGAGESFPFRVQTVSSGDGGEWGPITYVRNLALPRSKPVEWENGAVFINGVLHWLMSSSIHILTYNLDTSTAGLIQLPVGRLPADWTPRDSCLVSTPDGKTLRLLTVEGRLHLSIWFLSGSLGGWTRHAKVDMEDHVCDAINDYSYWDRRWIELETTGDQRSGTVLIRWHTFCEVEGIMVFDMETMDSFGTDEEYSRLPIEVNLASRLSAMKKF